MPRNSIDIFVQAKKQRRKVTMVTCYDYSMAKIVDKTGIDAVLVGDSMGMTMMGYSSTLPVEMDDIVRATQAVSRGAQNPLIIADMPFLSYQASFEEGFRNAGRLVKEGGANAVKLEGSTRATVNLVAELNSHGIPAIGHLGLTPQSVNKLGGYKVQGKNIDDIALLLLACERLADTGLQAIVLECVPAEVAKHITLTFPFATIGIGSGPYCDCEVQVLHDLLGLSDMKPKHAGCYLDGSKLIADALCSYDQDVKAGTFPTEDSCEHVDENLIASAESLLDDLFAGYLDEDGEDLDN